MDNKDTKNIFSLYCDNVLLEQAADVVRSTFNSKPDPSGLSGKSLAHLSRLEHLKSLLLTKKDISEEEKKRALAQIEGAIAKLKGQNPAAAVNPTTSQQPIQTNTQISRPIIR